MSHGKDEEEVEDRVAKETGTFTFHSGSRINLNFPLDQMFEFEVYCSIDVSHGK